MMLLINIAVDIAIFGLLIPAFFLYCSRELDRLLLVPEWNPPSLALVGYGFAVAGLALIIWSYICIVRIGRGYTLEFFQRSFLKPTQRLVTDGPFSIVRHPMSLGYLAFLLGIALIDTSCAGILIVLPALAAIASIYLFFVEERSLERRFDEFFHSYRNRTPFLIPRIERRRRKAKK